MTFRPIPKLVGHLRARLLFVLGVALLALGARLATPAPPARTADAIARMLGEAVRGSVGPGDFVWEERGGFFHDALLGRRVLFLAARGLESGRGAADLYRARVRLTRSGRPVSLHGVGNLTATHLGDDRDLVARGRRVAFTTAAFGAVQGISILDLGGDWAHREARSSSERLLAGVESWIETGSTSGVARTEIAFEKPPSAARIELVEDALVMALGPEALPAALDVRSGELNTGGKDLFGARAQHIPRPVRSFGEVAALSARRLAGARAARAVDRLSLGVRRILAPWRAEPPGAPRELAPFPPAPPAPPRVPALWPPPPIAAAVEPALQGEGVWVGIADPFPRPGVDVAAIASEAPGEPAAVTPFAATFIRPDPARRGARVDLLAIDTRRIELRLQAGYDAPRPATGPRGTGRLPEGPIGARVLGAITLDARSGHGPAREGGAASSDPESEASGTVVGGRILVPPRRGAATVAIDRHGRPFFGAWPFGEEVPGEIDSLWQSAVDPGAPDRNRVALADAIAERSALCTTDRGFVIHAWSGAIDAAALDRALVRAGCQASLPLGRTPVPLGFAFLSRRDAGGWSSERLSPAMSLSPERLAAGSPDAFIYLVSRDPAPAAPLGDGAAWTPDSGARPEPAFLPAVYAADVVHLGAAVRISAFSPDRFAFAIRAGSREISPRSAEPLPSALHADEQVRVLAAIGLGTGRRRGPRGLAVGGVVGLRFRREGGLLLVRGGRVEIRPATGAEIGAGTDATELPLTADDGKLRPEAREIGSMRRRGAACVLDDGALLVAATTFDSDEATTEALLDLGCQRVVALDRGRHQNAFVHRAGGEPPPEASYEETVLFAIESAMPGRARRFTASAP